MANVWEAMKKHQAQEAARRALPASHAAAPVPAAAAGGPQEQAGLPAVLLASPQQLQVPPVKPVLYHASLVPHADRGNRISEDYRELRTTLLAQCDNKGFCYLITSAEPGEGKTVTCLNLAMVLTECINRTTVVVDCDLRRGRVGDMLGVAPTPGLAELLRGRSTLKEIIQPTAYANLSVITAGMTRSEELSELLERADLDTALRDLRRTYDFVLIDTPPVNLVADVGIVGRSGAADALIVVRLNKTRRESVQRAVTLLQAANIKPSGVVLTHRRYYIPNILYRVS